MVVSDVESARLGFDQVSWSSSGIPSGGRLATHCQLIQVELHFIVRVMVGGGFSWLDRPDEVIDVGGLGGFGGPVGVLGQLLMPLPIVFDVVSGVCQHVAELL